MRRGPTTPPPPRAGSGPPAPPGRRQSVAFREEFSLASKVKSAKLYLACDDSANVHLDGKSVLSVSGTHQSFSKDLTAAFTGKEAGSHVLGIRARNIAGPAGVLARLVLELEGGGTQVVATDSGLGRARPPRRRHPRPRRREGLGQGRRDRPAGRRTLGRRHRGVAGQGDAGARRDRDRPVEAQGGQGLPGRLALLGAQGRAGLLGLHGARPQGPPDRLGPIRQALPGDFAAARREGRCPQGRAHPRRDRRGAGPALGLRQPLCRGQLGGQVPHRPLPGEGHRRRRHAGQRPRPCACCPAAPASTARTRSCSRPTASRSTSSWATRRPSAEVKESAVPRAWGEDILLPRMPDGNGFMAGVLAPGGCVYKINPEGTDWELVSMGFRNQYDAAFNREGELFTYDSDMEWDINTPWYRPTRVCHVVSGSEFGWRNGAGVWPRTTPTACRAPSTSAPGRQPASHSATAPSSRRSIRTPCSSATGATASCTPRTSSRRARAMPASSRSSSPACRCP